MRDKRLLALLPALLAASVINAQPRTAELDKVPEEMMATPAGTLNLRQAQWLPNSHQLAIWGQDGLTVYDPANLDSKTTLFTIDALKAAGLPVEFDDLVWSQNKKKVLLFTNTQRVWRAHTKGDFWYFDLTTQKGHQLGKGLPAASLMFAKLSPDGTKAAYVSKHNIYIEDITTGKIKMLTKDGTDRIINGTFDWAYEEELSCRDGFRWSPDSKQIAFWRLDATGIKFFDMINNTDSLYSFVVPVEYPKVGQNPSAAKIGVIEVATGLTRWLKIPGDAQQHYLPSMDWAGNSKEIMVAQLNRKQNESKLFLCKAATGDAKQIYQETSNAWIDVEMPFVYDRAGWTFIDGGKSFLWTSEKDGWRHIYRLSRDGSNETLITNGAFDADYTAVDEAGKTLYFNASPYDATQKYLYKVTLNGGDTTRLTPIRYDGTNSYDIAPDGLYAIQMHTNTHTMYSQRLVSLNNHNTLYPVNDQLKELTLPFHEYKFKVTTVDNVTMDGLIATPPNFDSTKKYPVLFYVYGEPASQTTIDRPLFEPFLAGAVQKGYIVITMDNRGTPAPKGTAWRKSIYGKIGVINSRDQAMAALEVFKAMPYVDSSRTAVFGWSGGGSMTLNLMFRYPQIYKTGIAVAAVANQLYYDNIYQERYMGVPPENLDNFIEGSPVTYAKNLQGNLLYIHGTGDDNVHYQNAEALINELVKYGKQFSFMAYPNRSHGIYERDGTTAHLLQLRLNYLLAHCPAGPR